MEQINKPIVKPEVILLDVYETLLDMGDVVSRVNNLMNSTRGYTLWFEMLMQYCFVDNCTGQFNAFDSIARATMQMTAKLLGTAVSTDDINGVLEMLKHLPVHDGVQEGLSHLTKDGYRIAALTNSSCKMVLNRMELTGLVSYFEMVLSAEQIKKYKPCVEVYEWVGQKLNVPLHKILLVSSHGWDIAGGANAGMQTAYIKQSRQMLYPLAPEPAFICTDLTNLADQLAGSSS
jgi:2-haloacid dehalogenase